MQDLHGIGQSIWLDNITRGILTDGTLRRYTEERSVTGLTSNPTIFDHAITAGDAYDDANRQKTAEGKSGEPMFFELAIEDLTAAADIFRPIMRARTALTAGCHWKFHLSWRTIPGPLRAAEMHHVVLAVGVECQLVSSEKAETISVRWHSENLRIVSFICSGEPPFLFRKAS